MASKFFLYFFLSICLIRVQSGDDEIGLYTEWLAFSFYLCGGRGLKSGFRDSFTQSKNVIIPGQYFFADWLSPTNEWPCFNSCSARALSNFNSGLRLDSPSTQKARNKRKTRAGRLEILSRIWDRDRAETRCSAANSLQQKTQFAIIKICHGTPSGAQFRCG